MAGSPGMLARGAYTACEHEVELLRLPDLIVRIWIPDIVLST